ncbi:alpha/beta-hydrolase [Penicillium longicatenatum]|nr:alpha/beta-hydrolase [Penicillium longicatenatum]
MAALEEELSLPTGVGPDLVEVLLPTKAVPSYEQRVIGKASEIEGVEAFRGIPYGVVPGRWQHALLRDKLPADIFNATKNGPRCPQAQVFNNSDFYQSHLDFPSDVAESEFDCLNLFITRPSASALSAAGIDYKAVKLPVYVYIHGGAYSFGAGTDPIWDPARLVKRSIDRATPIIVATINYRLNIFGFGASTEIIQAQPEGQLKGCNFGLTDQHIAIQWVHQNIAAFGGNVAQMTVGGQSAGGSSSHAHIAQAVFGKRDPLVHRAIIQSGAVGVLGPITMEQADRRWNTFCKQLNAPEDPTSRLAHMVNLSPDRLLKAFYELGWMVSPLVLDDLTMSENAGSQWRWNIHLDGPEADVIPKVPRDDVDPIAILIGDTDLEGTMHAGQVSKIKSYSHLQDLLARKIDQTEFRDQFCELYGIHADMSLPELHEQIYHFMTDLQFGLPVHLARNELRNCSTIVQKVAKDFVARPTNTQSFRVNVGNPFPGPNYQKAQHCVDLIYIYDAFAEALRAVDENLPAGVVKNHALVESFQEDWIRFIADPIDVREDGRGTYYNADRMTNVVDVDLDKEWSERRVRYDFLNEFNHASQQAMEALNGNGHSF